MVTLRRHMAAFYAELKCNVCARATHAVAHVFRRCSTWMLHLEGGEKVGGGKQVCAEKIFRISMHGPAV